MFLRKLIVILAPLCMLLFLCLIIPLLSTLPFFPGSVLLGLLLGFLLAMLLPLSGATRLREPFAWMLFFPSAAMLLILFYQFLAINQIGQDIPILHLLVTGDARILTVESAFASYMLTFSIRTGRGI